MASDKDDDGGDQHEYDRGSEGARRQAREAADSVPAGASAAESGAGADDESGDYGGETFRWKHHRSGIIETGDGREKRSPRQAYHKHCPPDEVPVEPEREQRTENSTDAGNAAKPQHHQDRRHADQQAAERGIEWCELRGHAGCTPMDQASGARTLMVAGACRQSWPTLSRWQAARSARRESAALRETRCPEQSRSVE